MFSIVRNHRIYPGAELLGNVAWIYSASGNNDEMFSRVVALIYTPTSSS